MAASVTFDSKSKGQFYAGTEKVRRGTITLGSSYATNGVAVTAKLFGLREIRNLEVQTKGGILFHWDQSTGKVKANLGTTDSSAPFVFAPGGGDLKGATAVTGTMGTADQAADVVNGNTWVNYQTFTTINGAAGSFGSITAQPGTGRNAIVSVKNDSGGALNLFTGTMTITVTGKFRGATQTDAIACTLTGGQVAVANTKFRAFAGSKPFDSITSVTIDATSLAAIVVADGGLKIGIGPGSKLGLPVDGDTNADADIIKCIVSGADYAITGKTDWTNKTIDVGTTADGFDFSVQYKADAEAVSGTAYGTSAGLPEVPASTDLSTVSARFEARGV